MDEIVYQREHLRRTLDELQGLLAKAADTYDPEEDLPRDDTIVAVMASFQLGEAVRKYTEAIKARMDARAAR